MSKHCPRLLFGRGLILAVLAVVASIPATANTANFGTLTLLPGFEQTQGTMTGYTGGSYSLSAISNRDRHKNACIGFGDPTPDHILVLKKNFPRLKIQVNSGGYDTTILVQGPDKKTIRCGDDTGKSKDASIEDIDWKAGTYHIWVATFNPGVKRDYTLSVQEK
jgi:pectate lyase